jgi:hypothetical protein
VHVSLLTPGAALVGLLAVPALIALAFAERRSRRVCAGLGLTPRSLERALGDAVALAAVGVLLGLAAAQPVFSTVRERSGRTDAEAIVVLDVSRSMLARPAPTQPMRLDRARALAKAVRAGIPEVPVGVASMSDRVLPHLFPSVSPNAFAATVDRAIGIERPPPNRALPGGRVSALGSLADLGRSSFFGPEARRRVAVILTDAETVEVDTGTLRARLARGRILPVFVQVWRTEERIFGARTPAERAYRPDPTSAGGLERLAEAIGGLAFTEDELAEARGAVAEALGDGPTAPQRRELRSAQLAPAVAAAALLPLLWLLRRRNLAPAANNRRSLSSTLFGRVRPL